MGEPDAPDPPERAGEPVRRLILALLLVGAAMVLFPGLRERAEPRIRDTGAWLWDKLEGPMGPVLTPYRTLTTQSRIDEALPRLNRDRNQGRRAPEASQFTGYLEGHGINPLDAWGNPLIIQQEPDSVAIISSGPDSEYFTEDDIVRRVRFAEPKYRGFRRR